MVAYVSGEPRPYIHETDATIITSRLSINERVALFLNFSISSLMAESFSIYVSLDGIYASG